VPQPFWPPGRPFCFALRPFLAYSPATTTYGYTHTLDTSTIPPKAPRAGADPRSLVGCLCYTPYGCWVDSVLCPLPWSKPAEPGSRHCVTSTRRAIAPFVDWRRTARAVGAVCFFFLAFLLGPLHIGFSTWPNWTPGWTWTWTRYGKTWTGMYLPWASRLSGLFLFSLFLGHWCPSFVYGALLPPVWRLLCARLGEGVYEKRVPHCLVERERSMPPHPSFEVSTRPDRGGKQLQMEYYGVLQMEYHG
jgi:hypothetical protein